VVGASASCAALTPRQLEAHAQLIVVGTFLPGPSVSTGGTVLLTSPARLRVEHYLKGNGPRVLLVQTGLEKRGRTVAESEDGVVPRSGERWKIISSSSRSPVSTSMCSGSSRLRTTPHTPS
jgi:hypothetical protein